MLARCKILDTQNNPTVDISEDSQRWIQLGGWNRSFIGRTSWPGGGGE